PDAERQRARALLPRMAALIGLVVSPKRVAAARREGTIARSFLAALGARPTARAEAVINRALIVCADHELNPSTFTVRIAASAKADLYACVSAGLATAQGPLHCGMC